MGTLRNVTQGCVVATNVVRAETEAARVVGFLAKRHVDADDGIWFPRCNSIHTFGMRAKIDVVFLDDRSRVTRIVEAAGPWRLLYAGSRAAHAVELAAGSAQRTGLAVGDVLALDEVSGADDGEQALDLGL